MTFFIASDAKMPIGCIAAEFRYVSVATEGKCSRTEGGKIPARDVCEMNPVGCAFLPTFASAKEGADDGGKGTSPDQEFAASHHRHRQSPGRIIRPLAVLL